MNVQKRCAKRDDAVDIWAVNDCIYIHFCVQKTNENVEREFNTLPLTAEGMDAAFKALYQTTTSLWWTAKEFSLPQTADERLAQLSPCCV
jgi:hypothetical protein